MVCFVSVCGLFGGVVVVCFWKWLVGFGEEELLVFWGFVGLNGGILLVLEGSVGVE